jgi:serine/threonine protein kinase
LLLSRLSIDERERYLAVADQRGRPPQPVAILILPPSQATRQHLRVLDEVSAANDQVPTIIDYDVQPARSVIVLKWVHGPTLAELIDKMKTGVQRRMSPTVAFQRIRGLAYTLWSRHGSQQIVHGDIKPANIVVAVNPGRFILIDFGSAWQVHATAWRDSGDGISPIYAAPELQSGDRFVDFRSDQFSVSVILYQLLTLQIPYGGLGGKVGRSEYCAAKVPRLVPPSQISHERQTIPRQVWRGLDRVTLRGLALDPGQHYPTPEAWLDDLREVNLDIQRPRSLSPVHDRLTHVVGWLARLFRLG